MSTILPPPPPREEFFLEEDDYEFLLGDIAQAIEDANRKYGFGEDGYIDHNGDFCPFDDNDKPRFEFKFKPVIATAVKKTKIQEQDEEVECLNFLRSKMRAADPSKKKRFADMVEGVKFEDE